MSIGRGWYPEELIDPTNNELRVLATSLFKDKLDEVFDKIKTNPNREKMAIKGKNNG